MRFGHNALRIKNTEAMLDYYINKLGFEEAFKILNDDGSIRIVYVHISDGQYLELCLGGEDRPEFDDQKSVGLRHIAFTVDNLEETKKDLESRGVVFDSEILFLRDKNYTAYLFDPDGNKLEIVQTTSESPHQKFEMEHKLH